MARAEASTYRRQPGTYRHCQSLPGITIPRGFLIDWDKTGNHYVAARTVRVGPSGHIDVPVELEGGRVSKKLAGLTAQLEKVTSQLALKQQSRAHIERNDTKWCMRRIVALETLRLRRDEKYQLLMKPLERLPAPDPTDPRAAAILRAIAAEEAAGEYFGRCEQKFREQRRRVLVVLRQLAKLERRKRRLQQAWQKAWLAEAKAAER
jgi:hypothetical protein